MGLYFMDVLQTSKTNPAYISDKKIEIGLPSIHLNYFNTGGSFNKLLVDYLNDKNSISVGNALNDLSKTDNVLRGVFEIETLHLRYRLGNIQLGLSHAQKTDVYMNFPKTMAKLFFEGNGQYIGQNIALDNELQLTSYNEFALSGAMKLSKLQIGARVKYLTGIANISTGNKMLSLYTDDDIYQLTLQTDYELNVSTLLSTNELSSFDLRISSNSLKNLLTKNSGAAIDLGVTYNVNKKLKIGASLLDLGQIKWTENATNYSSKGTVTYAGFDFAQFAKNDSISFNSAIDTLQSAFDFHQNHEDYSTTLPTKFYLSGSYQLNKMIRLGGLFYNETYRGQNFQMIALSGNAKLSKILSVGAVYSARKESPFNLGLNFVLKLGPAQIFATTDNVIAVFQPYKSSNVNLRGGVNLLF
ncbi:MAG TPA: hypothetical protein ENJ53_08670 [Phaeodactylibacter sp.]|nr:hypothetical protein [Phaeodactylibacter sp.]